MVSVELQDLMIPGLLHQEILTLHDLFTDPVYKWKALQVLAK